MSLTSRPRRRRGAGRAAGWSTAATRGRVSQRRTACNGLVTMSGSVKDDLGTVRVCDKAGPDAPVASRW